MPELRWYYELYRNDHIGYEFATKYLEHAYLSNECDQKTVDMLFDSYLKEANIDFHYSKSFYYEK